VSSLSRENPAEVEHRLAMENGKMIAAKTVV
jgi:hypothetical protein